MADAINGFQRLIVWGIPSALLVIGALSIESTFLRLPSIGKHLGDASYSIYLSHTFVISIFAKLWTMTAGAERGALFAIAGLTVCAIGGSISYAIIERPLARWRKNSGTP